MIAPLTTLALAFAAAPLVAGHGFIKDVTVNGQKSRAQKTDIKQSSFRSAPLNTGWTGDQFLGSDCAVCGCSETPFNRVAAPSGTVFSTAGQSAGQTPSVRAGDKVTLHVAGNPGEGWPHPNGHMQAYLGSCGDSCENFDAKTADYFKIQGIKDGIPALRAAFDRASDSNPWDIPIPSGVANGKYILRAEIWAYDQSSEAEGRQVQFYPFCMNVEITNGGNANPATVNFPGEYAQQRQQIVSQGRSLLPGPDISQQLGGSGTGVGSSNNNSGNRDNSSSNNSPSPPASNNSNNNSGSGSSNNGNNGGGSRRTGKKCKAVSSSRKSKKQKRRSGSSTEQQQHRRHHERNLARAGGHRHASS